jgi:hypothetical protein
MNCIGLVYLIRGLQRRRELQQQQLQESADADVEGGEEVSDDDNDDDDDDNADDVGCFVVFAVSVAITSAVLLFAVVAYIISQDTRCPYVTA